MRPINKIILHCSDNPSPEWGFDECRRDHLSRGWQDIGYHYFIDSYGAVWVGRAEKMVGAHCDGHNADSLGVCLNGREMFYERQRQALEGLLRELHTRYPRASLHGHREFNPGKTCPNFDYSQELQLWTALT